MQILCILFSIPPTPLGGTAKSLAVAYGYLVFLKRLKTNSKTNGKPIKKDIRFQFVLSFASIRFGKPQRPAWKAVHSVTDCAEDQRSGAVGATSNHPTK